MLALLKINHFFKNKINLCFSDIDLANSKIQEKPETSLANLDTTTTTQSNLDPLSLKPIDMRKWGKIVQICHCGSIQGELSPNLCKLRSIIL